MQIGNENEILQSDHFVYEKMSVNESLANKLVVFILPNEYLNSKSLRKKQQPYKKRRKLALTF